MSKKQNSGNGIFLKIQGLSIHFTGSSYILAPNGGQQLININDNGTI
jgi:hypothetical protein